MLYLLCECDYSASSEVGLVEAKEGANFKKLLRKFNKEYDKAVGKRPDEMRMYRVKNREKAEKEYMKKFLVWDKGVRAYLKKEYGLDWINKGGAWLIWLERNYGIKAVKHESVCVEIGI
jgi:hypothetical protein